MPLISRRSLLVGFGAVLCAPAIVRASSLMPVKAIDLFASAEWHAMVDHMGRQMSSERLCVDILQITKTHLAAYQEPAG